MCGIFAIFSSSLSDVELRKSLIECSSKLRHRGPDWSGYKVISKDKNAGRPLSHGIAHERLAIMDPESGEQPLVSRDGSVIVAANGEIYNYKELYAELTTPYTPMTGSDCEVILPLYAEFGPTESMVDRFRGMFSFVLYDKSKDVFMVVRDHIGKTPLYIGWANDGSVYVASDLKAIVGYCNRFQNFPPGHIFVSKGEHANEFIQWFKPLWRITPEGGPLPTEKFQAVSLENGSLATHAHVLPGSAPQRIIVCFPFFQINLRLTTFHVTGYSPPCL